MRCRRARERRNELRPGSPKWIQQLPFLHGATTDSNLVPGPEPNYIGFVGRIGAGAVCVLLLPCLAVFGQKSPSSTGAKTDALADIVERVSRSIVRVSATFTFQ